MADEERRSGQTGKEGDRRRGQGQRDGGAYDTIKRTSRASGRARKRGWEVGKEVHGKLCARGGEGGRGFNLQLLYESRGVG
eukprot:730535-Hanusia_phi.AAC.1